jgi:arylsulfatase A-like enzyme
MKHNQINYILRTILFTISICFLFSVKSKALEQPNILLIYIDDLGWMDLSVQGSQFYETPNIDKLASEGVRFTQAYSAHPRCVPARYGLMTGRFPARAGVPGGGKLTPKDVTIAEALKRGGYTTFFTGKWHLLFNDEQNMPQHQGFDINIGGGNAGQPPSYWYPYRKGESTDKGRRGLLKTELYNIKGGEKGEYLTDRLTDESIKFITSHVENNENPFFLMLSHYAVHGPLKGKPKLVKKYEEKLKTMTYNMPESEKTRTGDNKLRQDNPVYAAVVESVDQSVGKIMKTLKELGIDNNTIVVFTSDNGGVSTRGNNRPLATTNYPLRYGKGWLYEGGIREAFIVKYPPITEAGTTSDAVISGTDIYPTLLSLAGMELRPNDHLDGIDISDAIKGKQIKREKPLFWHAPWERPVNTGDNRSTAIRLGDYKLIDWYDLGVQELYNIEKDIKEENNLIEKMPEKAEELQQLIDNWRREINSVMHPKSY